MWGRGEKKRVYNGKGKDLHWRNWGGRGSAQKKVGKEGGLKCIGEEVFDELREPVWGMKRGGVLFYIPGKHK